MEHETEGLTVDNDALFVAKLHIQRVGLPRCTVCAEQGAVDAFLRVEEHFDVAVRATEDNLVDLQVPRHADHPAARHAEPPLDHKRFRVHQHHRAAFLATTRGLLGEPGTVLDLPPAMTSQDSQLGEQKGTAGAAGAAGALTPTPFSAAEVPVRIHRSSGENTQSVVS